MFLQLTLDIFIDFSIILVNIHCNDFTSLQRINTGGILDDITWGVESDGCAEEFVFWRRGILWRSKWAWPTSINWLDFIVFGLRHNHLADNGPPIKRPFWLRLLYIIDESRRVIDKVYRGSVSGVCEEGPLGLQRVIVTQDLSRFLNFAFFLIGSLCGFYQVLRRRVRRVQDRFLFLLHLNVGEFILQS